MPRLFSVFSEEPSKNFGRPCFSRISAGDICPKQVFGSAGAKYSEFWFRVCGLCLFHKFLLSVFAQPAGNERRNATSPVGSSRTKTLAAEGKASDSFAGTLLPAASARDEPGSRRLEKTQPTHLEPQTWKRALIRLPTATAGWSWRKILEKHCRPCLALAQKSTAEECLRRLAGVFSSVQDYVLRSSVVQTCRCGLPIGAAHPANSATNRAKGMA